MLPRHFFALRRIEYGLQPRANALKETMKNVSATLLVIGLLTFIGSSAAAQNARPATAANAGAETPLSEKPPMPGMNPGDWARLRAECRRLREKSASGQRLEPWEGSETAKCRSSALGVRMLNEHSGEGPTQPNRSGSTPLGLPSVAPTPS